VIEEGAPFAARLLGPSRLCSALLGFAFYFFVDTNEEAAEAAAKIEVGLVGTKMTDCGKEDYLLAWGLVAKQSPWAWNLVLRSIAPIREYMETTGLVGPGGSEAMKKIWVAETSNTEFAVKWLDGQEHAVGGPAISAVHGDEEYEDEKVVADVYMNYGRLHREDGPAVVLENKDYSKYFAFSANCLCGRLANNDQGFALRFSCLLLSSVKIWVDEDGRLSRATIVIHYGRRRPNRRVSYVFGTKKWVAHDFIADGEIIAEYLYGPTDAVSKGQIEMIGAGTWDSTEDYDCLLQRMMEIAARPHSFGTAELKNKITEFEGSLLGLVDLSADPFAFSL